jgi:hypothetical protein
VSFPVPEKAGWQKFKQPASRFSIVGVFVSKGPQGVRVAVTGAGAAACSARRPGGQAGRQLVGRGAERRHGQRRRPEQRPARLGRIPRRADPGAGGARRRLSVSILAAENAAVAAAFCFGASAVSDLPTSIDDTAGAPAGA